MRHGLGNDDDNLIKAKTKKFKDQHTLNSK